MKMPLGPTMATLVIIVCNLRLSNIFASKIKRTIIGDILKELNLQMLCILKRFKQMSSCQHMQEMVFDNHCHPITDRLYTQLSFFVTVVYC